MKVQLFILFFTAFCIFGCENQNINLGNKDINILEEEKRMKSIENPEDFGAKSLIYSDNQLGFSFEYPNNYNIFRVNAGSFSDDQMLACEHFSRMYIFRKMNDYQDSVNFENLDGESVLMGGDFYFIIKSYQDNFLSDHYFIEKHENNSIITPDPFEITNSNYKFVMFKRASKEGIKVIELKTFIYPLNIKVENPNIIIESYLESFNQELSEEIVNDYLNVLNSISPIDQEIKFARNFPVIEGESCLP